MTYRSARDLPTFREMAQPLQGFKLLGFLLCKDTGLHSVPPTSS
jgi:hypothetical protein